MNVLAVILGAKADKRIVGEILRIGGTTLNGILNIYSTTHNTYTINDTVYVACNKADKRLFCLCFDSDVFKNNVLYLVFQRFILVVIARNTSYNTEKADYISAAEFVRTTGRCAKLIIVVLNGKIGYGYSIAVEATYKGVINRADGGKLISRHIEITFNIGIQLKIEGISKSVTIIVGIIEISKILKPGEIVKLYGIGNTVRSFLASVTVCKVVLMYSAGYVYYRAQAVVRHPCQAEGLHEHGNGDHDN